MDGIDSLVTEFLGTIPLLEGTRRKIELKDLTQIFAPYTGREVDPRELEALELTKVARALDELGVLEYRKQKFENARTYVRAARTLLPESREFAHDLGMIEFSYGNFESARELFMQGVRSDQWGERDTHNLGLTLMQLGEFEKAIPYLDAAIGVLQSAHSYAARGLVHLKLNNQAEALEDIQNAFLKNDERYRELHKSFSDLNRNTYQAA